jgi:hypothetical protein
VADSTEASTERRGPSSAIIGPGTALSDTSRARRYQLHATTVTVLFAWNGRTADLPARLFPHVRTRSHDGAAAICPFRCLARLREGTRS